MVAENIIKICPSSILGEAKNFSAKCWYYRLDLPYVLCPDVDLGQHFCLIKMSEMSMTFFAVVEKNR
jgi:hypothetical protein